MKRLGGIKRHLFVVGLVLSFTFTTSLGMAAPKRGHNLRKNLTKEILQKKVGFENRFQVMVPGSEVCLERSLEKVFPDLDSTIILCPVVEDLPGDILGGGTLTIEIEDAYEEGERGDMFFALAIPIDMTGTPGESKWGINISPGAIGLEIGVENTTLVILLTGYLKCNEKMPKAYSITLNYG